MLFIWLLNSKRASIVTPRSFTSSECSRLTASTPTRSFAGPFAPLRVLLSFLTDVISHIPQKNSREFTPPFTKISAKISQLCVHPPLIMCTSAFNSDVCHRLKRPVLFALRFNNCNPQKISRELSVKNFTNNFTIMCTSAFNYVYTRL